MYRIRSNTVRLSKYFSDISTALGGLFTTSRDYPSGTLREQSLANRTVLESDLLPSPKSLMAYNNFTLESVRHQFGLNILGTPFCQDLPPVAPSETFAAIFAEWYPRAKQARSEKAKSELLVSPVLLEVTKLANNSVELFSGEEFSVDKEQGLNGCCDFLLSRSTAPYIIEAPIVMLVEAKKGELDLGLGQCISEMVAAQLFNENEGKAIPVIYGCVTSGKLWQFLKLEGKNVSIDVNEYQIVPVDRIIGILKWMVSETD